MFDLSLGEILLLLMVAAVFIGPKEMPTVIRGIAKLLRSLRALGNEIRAAFDDLAKETGTKEALDDMNDSIRYIRGDDGKLYESYDVSSHQPKEDKPIAR